MENEVLIERIENLRCLVESNHKENKEEHQTIIEQVKFTNGKVRSLQIWKASIVGALTIITLISGYMINDYLSNKENIKDLDRQIIVEQTKHEKVDALNEQRLTAIEKELVTH